MYAWAEGCPPCAVTLLALVVHAGLPHLGGPMSKRADRFQMPTLPLSQSLLISFAICHGWLSGV